MKKIYYITLGVILLLLITNPSIKAFKDYTGSDTYVGLKKTSNFFVCSVYNDGNKYFAIAGNFFKIVPYQSTSAATDTITMDSTSVTGEH